MKTIYDKHLSLAANRFNALNLNQQKSLPIVLTSDKIDNYIKALDYLQSLSALEYETIINNTETELNESAQ